MVRLYVVIRIVLEAELYRPHFLPSFNEQFTDRIKYLQVTKNNLQRWMSTLNISSPSIMPKSPTKLDGVQASATRIGMGYRPHDVFGPHPALFCPPFAYAHNMYKDLPSVKIEAPKGLDGEFEDFHMDVWVTQFAQCCYAITAGERNLGDTIDQYLRKLVDDEDLTRHSTYADDIGRPPEIDWSGECRTAHGLRAIYLAVKLKETPFCGREPMMQISSFQSSLPLEKYSEHLLRMSCCPCLIMSIAGFQVTVDLAYFTDSVHTTELFTMSLKRSPEPFRLRDHAAKFQIVRDTAKRMREWYTTIHTGSILPHLPYLFPQPSSIISLLDPDNHEVIDAIKSLRLIFTEEVGPSKKSSRCLYRGVMINPGACPTAVYIKFVGFDFIGRSYGQEQHQLLAAHHFAPRLHLCCEVVRGITMVVMDDLGGCSLTEGFARKYVPTLRRDLTAAVKLLKRKNYVHGDLRPENVVVRQEEDGPHAYLIDFDWAGVALEARYPPSLNADIDWPRPVEEMKCRVIRQDDDSIMLRKLLGDDDNDDDSGGKRPREEDARDMAEDGGRRPCKKSRGRDLVDLKHLPPPRSPSSPLLSLRSSPQSSSPPSSLCHLL